MRKKGEARAGGDSQTKDRRPPHLPPVVLVLGAWENGP